MYVFGRHYYPKHFANISVESMTLALLAPVLLCATRTLGFC